MTLKAVKHRPTLLKSRLPPCMAVPLIQCVARQSFATRVELLGHRIQSIDHQTSVLMMSPSHSKPEISFGVNGKLIDIECTFLVGPPRPRFGWWYLD